MKKENSLIVKNNNLSSKILNKIKKIFNNGKKEKYENYIKENNNLTVQNDNENKKIQFLEQMKAKNIDYEIISLKNKLETGKINAMDLTDEQIDKLQKIYDKEIEEKQMILKKLKNIE